MNLYQDLGISRLINAAGTYTTIGGNRMSESTLQALCEAAHWNVDIDLFQRTVSERIAKATHNEAAFVCNSCTSGLYLSAAALIEEHLNKPYDTLTEKERRRCHITAFWGHHVPYDYALTQAGASLKYLGYPNPARALPIEIFESSLNADVIACYFAPRTPLGYYGEESTNLADVIRVSHDHGIPVLVDAAAQLPPKSNLWLLTQMGADIVCFSGGKDLAGPQASGLLLGKAHYIRLIERIGFPHAGCGRMMKVGREEIAALYSALLQYMNQDETARLESCEEMIRLLVCGLKNANHLSVERVWPNEAGQPLPRAFVRINDDIMSAKRLRELLLAGDPAIYCHSENQPGVFVNPMTLRFEEIDLIVTKLRDIDRNGGE